MDQLIWAANAPPVLLISPVLLIRSNLAHQTWESMDAIRQFAGDQLEMAVVAPAVQAILRTLGSTLTHSDVLLKR